MVTLGMNSYAKRIKINYGGLNTMQKTMKCIECVHCNAEKMKCFPKSKDCGKEYTLTEQDLYTKAKCDFSEKA